MDFCGVSIGNDKIRYVSNNDRPRSDYSVTPNRNSVRDAGAHADSRALPYLDKPARRNSRSYTRKFVHYAVVVNGTPRVEDAEFSDPRPGSNVRACKNNSARADLSRACHDG